MKRGVFGILLLLVIFAGSFLYSFLVKNQICPLIENLEQASQAVLREDLKETAALTEKVSAAWEDYRLKFSCFSHQNSVREIDSLMSEIKVFYTAGELTLCRAACVQLKNQMQALLEDQLPCFRSLL